MPIVPSFRRSIPVLWVQILFLSPLLSRHFPLFHNSVVQSQCRTTMWLPFQASAVRISILSSPLCSRADPVPKTPTENLELLEWLFVTEEDIKSLPCFQINSWCFNETIIAIKAPYGTTLEVPDPDEAVDYPSRRYRIILRSTMGPIDIYLVNQFEEKFEETNAVEVPPNIPSTFGVNEDLASTSGLKESGGKEIEENAQEGNRICSDIGTSQDFVSGIMKIVPDVDVHRLLFLFDVKRVAPQKNLTQKKTKEIWMEISGSHFVSWVKLF